MLNKLKPKSEFSRNVLTLMTGTTIAQAIPIAISPILTRIYTPEDFGVLALFVAISSIFGSISNAKYEEAIMLPRKDEDAINIFALGFIITSVISLILLVLAILFNSYFAKALGNEKISLWLYFVPFFVFFTGFWNILNYFNNRKKNYKDLKNAVIVKSIISASVQLSVGFLKQGESGLINAQLFSQFFANVRLLKNIIKDKVFFSKISRVKIIALAKRYKDFPIYSSWAILSNNLSIYLINMLISTFYTVSTLGFFSLSQRLLGVPSSLIGSSIGQVFLEEATREKQKTGRAVNAFISTLKKLILIGFPLFFTLFFIVEDVFAFIFGEDWRIAGTYAQILIPMFFMQFMVSSLSSIDTVMEKQKIFLFFNISLLASSILVFYIFNDKPFIEFITYYSIQVSFIYFIYGIILYKMSNNSFL